MNLTRKYLLCLLLLFVVFSLGAQQMYGYRYWFDSDIAIAQEDSSASSQFSLELDVSDLSEGMHQLNVQVKDSSGLYSSARSAMFWKQVYIDTTSYIMRYWFDDDTQKTESYASSGVQMIDVSSLPSGMHSLNVQVKSPDGRYSPIQVAMFWKLDMLNQGYKCHYYIDDSLFQTHHFQAIGELVKLSIDVNELPYGLHMLRVQIDNAKGEPVALAQQYFIRELGANQFSKARCIYTIDDSGVFGEAPQIQEGMFKFDVNIDHLMAGVHQLTCMILDDQNQCIQIRNHFFMKSHSEMVRYDYWVNADTASMRVVPILPADTCHLVDLMQVASYPFTTKSFNFEVEDGIPYVYAKNNLHVKLYNSQGAYVQESQSYSDLSSKREVSDVIALNAGILRTDRTPADNNIRWYKIYADEAHELEFSVSQACDVQLFTPDGECLMEASGKEVCDTLSCRVSQSGIYYLALHDVTGTSVNTSVYYHNNDTLRDAQGLIYCANATHDAYDVVSYVDSLKSEVVIPAHMYGIPVNAIMKGAFAGAEQLRRITIPESIKSVGEGIFSGCYNLLVVDWNSPATLAAECFDDAKAYGNMLVFSKTSGDFNGNVVLNGVAENITLIDAKDFFNPRAFTAKYISYSRTFSKETFLWRSAGWESMVLPFDVQIIENKEKACRLAPFGYADYVQVMPMWVADWKAESNVFARCDFPSANVPFIVQVPNNEALYEEKFNMNGAIVFSAQQTKVLPTNDLQIYAQNADYQFVPTYKNLTSAANIYALNDAYYGISGEVIAPGGAFVAGLRDVRPFEAYIQKTTANTQQASYIRVGVDVATGMESILQSELLWPQEDVWYNLQGLRLPSRPTQPGLYIHNGEKVMIK